MLLDILDEGMAHAYRMLTGTHQQIGIAVYIMYLEKELRLALVILQNSLQVANHRFIYRIALHIDGKAVDAVLLDRLQILHIAYLEIEIVGIAVTGNALGGDVDGAAFNHDTAPLAPVLAKESQLA